MATTCLVGLRRSLVRDSLSVTYLHHHADTTYNPGPASSAVGAGTDLGGLEEGISTGNYLSASEIRIFSPTVLNEADVGVRFSPHNVNQGTDSGASVNTALGLPIADGTPSGISGGPSFNITGMAPLIWGGVSETNARNYSVRDDLTWTVGRSTFKFGAEYIRITGYSNSFNNVFGTYNFTGLFTGNGFADFLLGLPSSTSRSLPQGASDTAQEDFGFYAEDSFRPTKKWTINLGLRAEKLRPRIEENGKYYNFDRTTGDIVLPSQSSLRFLNPGFPPIVLDHIVVNQGSFPDQLLNPIWSVTPRIGLAYLLTPNTVVRGAFGSYGTLLGLATSTGSPYGAGAQSFTNVNTCVSTPVTCTPAFTLSNPFPSTTTAAVSGLSPSGVNPHYKSPVTYQWNLTVEHRLPYEMVLRTTYAGSESVQLPFSANINIPSASTIPFSQDRLHFPWWNGVTYTDTGGTSSFNALEVNITKQFAHGISFMGDWNWSKCLSDVDEGGLELGTSGPGGPMIEDPYNRDRDKGNCESTPQHFFKGSFVAESPFGSGHLLGGNLHGFGGGVVNQVLGGWTFSGYFQARTGLWKTAYWTGYDATNTGNTFIRPNQTEGCSGRAHPQTATNIFDVSCFTKPTAGSYGTAPMGNILGLGVWKLDGGIYKYFTLAKSEYVPKLRISMTANNILGHQALVAFRSAPFIVNGAVGSGVNMANTTFVDSGIAMNLGSRRIIYFQAQLEW